MGIMSAAPPEGNGIEDKQAPVSTHMYSGMKPLEILRFFLKKTLDFY